MSQNVKTQPRWPEEVFERLLEFALDWDSPEILEELLQLAHRLHCVPRANSEVLAKACEKNNYDLVKPLVERGYRFRPHMLDKTMEKKRTIAQLILRRVEYDQDETFETDKQIQNLKILGLAAKTSYILACYMNLVGKYDWEATTVCECYDDTAGDHISKELRRHHCPTHRNFKPHLLCSAHLECNDPVTRCFLLAEACSDMADDCPIYRTGYRD